MKLKGKLNWSCLTLLAVLVIFLFLRFYQLPQRTIFNWDQERDAFEVQKILSGDPSLIGPRVLGPQGFFLGPYFYYLLAPFYFLTGGHPQAIVYFLIVLNLVFFLAAYLIVKKIWGEKTALIFLFLWTINPAAIETVAWNPTLIPLMIILIWFTLSQKSYFWLGLSLSLAINFHFQAVFLAPFILLFLFWQRELSGKNLGKAALGFFLPFIPLLLFDLRHNFLNFKLLGQFIKERGEGGNFLAWRPVLANFLTGFWGEEKIWLPLTLALVLLTLWLVKKQKNYFSKNFLKSLLFLYPIVLLGFSIYGQRPSEYYFNFLLPFFILVLALFISSFGKLKRLFFLLLFILLWLPKTMEKTVPVSVSLLAKDKAIAYLVEKNGKIPAEVRYQTPLGEEAGFSYLLNYYGLEKATEGERKIWLVSIPPAEESQAFGGVGVKLIGEEKNLLINNDSESSSE
ncbi:MAG: ArnT family glycosyltransferase [Patescibacteria group bacterium]|jgi:4-amino-4-deoxy-L-arabinose transferase-like glycosyltransferase